MKHAERRALKDSISIQAQHICGQICSQQRVPDRVINGDAISAIEWKNNRETAFKLAQKQLNKLSLNKMREALEEIIYLSKKVL